MKTYQYQVLRYVHDHLTGEFVNMGIVFFEPQTKFLRAAMLSRTQRVAQFFAGVDGRRLLTVLRHLEQSIETRGKAIEAQLGLEPVLSVEQITSGFIASNDAAWQWTPVQYGLTEFPAVSLKNLFERLVLRYAEATPPSRPSDEDVWRQTYKKYFDLYRVTAKLYPRIIPTAHDVIQFHQTYQNGALHCYEALTFDLERPETVKAKAYKWFGLLNELRTSNEMVHVHLLTAPPAHNSALWEFVEQKLTSASGNNVLVEVLLESDAERVAQRLRRFVDEHPTH